METLAQSLFALIRQGNLQAVGDMLKMNPMAAHVTDGQGVTPVLFAQYCGRTDLAKTIAALRATPLSLYEAAALGDTVTCGRILDNSPKVIDRAAGDGFTALHLAAFFGHPEVVELLLKRGADANAISQNPAGLRPLHSAAAQKDPAKALESARLLLEAGADPNALQTGGFTAADAAQQNGNEALLKLLEEKGAAIEPPS